MNRRRLPAWLPTLSLLLILVLQADSRPSTEDAEVVLPPDMDNVEIHQVKMVNGVMHEDHPIIMYKEDFVNEDYHPLKNDSHPVEHKQHRHLRHQRPAPLRELADKQIIFDNLPNHPIDFDNDDVENLKPTKHPKKYHGRHRRQAYASWPQSSFYQTPYQSVYYQAPGPAYLPPQTNYPHQGFAVAGKPPKHTGKLSYWQTKTKVPTPAAPIDEPISIDNRIIDESNPLFHSSDPAQADFSIFDQVIPNRNQISGGNNNNNWQSPPETDQRPVWGQSASRRPNTGRAPLPTSRPSFQGPPLPTVGPNRGRPATRPTTRAPTTAKVSNCVWAIVNCCSQGTKKIRYQCFEDFGCHGAFWGINPCAEDVHGGFVNIVSSAFP